jgi:hypothetical protein
MTDRLWSCKESPDGKHLFVATGQTPPRVTCRFCAWEMPPTHRAAPLEQAGWNAPAIDPDAHLGGVE